MLWQEIAADRRQLLAGSVAALCALAAKFALTGRLTGPARVIRPVLGCWD